MRREGSERTEASCEDEVNDKTVNIKFVPLTTRGSLCHPVLGRKLLPAWVLTHT